VRYGLKLSQQQGSQIWLDARKMCGGDFIQHSLTNAIDNALHFVALVILSAVNCARVQNLLYEC
jgi:hypothetical protein